MRLRYTDYAEVDLASTLKGLAAVSPEGARRLAARIKGVEQLLLQFPKIGSTTRLPWLRRITVHGYPYVVFYEVADGDVLIHAVRHGARRPLDDAGKP